MTRAELLAAELCPMGEHPRTLEFGYVRPDGSWRCRCCVRRQRSKQPDSRRRYQASRRAGSGRHGAGWCDMCFQLVALTAVGALRGHGKGCPGGGMLPVVEAPAALGRGSRGRQETGRSA